MNTFFFDHVLESITDKYKATEGFFDKFKNKKQKDYSYMINKLKTNLDLNKINTYTLDELITNYEKFRGYKFPSEYKKMIHTLQQEYDNDPELESNGIQDNYYGSGKYYDNVLYYNSAHINSKNNKQQIWIDIFDGFYIDTITNNGLYCDENIWGNNYPNRIEPPFHDSISDTTFYGSKYYIYIMSNKRFEYMINIKDNYIYTIDWHNGIFENTGYTCKSFINALKGGM